MQIDSRRLWEDIIKACQLRIDTGDNATISDVILLKAYWHMQNLEARLAEIGYYADLQMSREMTMEQKAIYISQQLENEDE
jgi:hypothetical protein